MNSLGLILQNVIMMMYLSKSHVVVQYWENGRFCKVSVVTFFIQDPFLFVYYVYD